LERHYDQHSKRKDGLSMKNNMTKKCLKPTKGFSHFLAGEEEIEPPLTVLEIALPSAFTIKTHFFQIIL